VTVQISGSVQVTNEQGLTELIFSASRKVPHSSGSSTTRIPLPGPDEVLSFELPPISTLVEQYSVRVRIR
jgi:hypothetical protein